MLGGKVGFCANFHRLALVSSRQRNGLLLVVDFDSTIQSRKKKGPPPQPEQVLADEEQQDSSEEAGSTHDAQYLDRMFRYSRDISRMIEQQANDIPDTHLS